MAQGGFSVGSLDVANGFHMLEDIDFSTRVALRYGGRLYINTQARLAHHCSTLNRDVIEVRQRKKIIEYFIYYKKRKSLPWATLSFSWVMLGLFLEATFQSLITQSLGPVKGYYQGVLDGSAKKLIT